MADTVTPRLRRRFSNIQSAVQWLLLSENCLLGPEDPQDPRAPRVIVPKPEPNPHKPPKRVPCWGEVDTKDLALGDRPTHQDHFHRRSPRAADRDRRVGSRPLPVGHRVHAVDDPTELGW
jgi:hypothetical protein